MEQGRLTQRADIMTKSLGKFMFEEMREKIAVHDLGFAKSEGHIQTSQGIDLRLHYIRSCIEDEMVEIKHEIVEIKSQGGHYD